MTAPDWLLDYMRTQEKAGKGVGLGMMNFSPVHFAKQGLGAHEERIRGLLSPVVGDSAPSLSDLISEAEGGRSERDLASHLSTAPLRLAIDALPIVPDPLKWALRQSPFYTGEDVGEFEARLAQDIEGSTAGQAGRIIGKWAPELISGAFAVQGTATRAVHMLRNPKLTEAGMRMNLALPTSRTIREKSLELLSPVHPVHGIPLPQPVAFGERLREGANKLLVPLSGAIQRQSAQLARRPGDIGGVTNMWASGMPAAERFAISVGNMVGAGAYNAMLDLSLVSEEELDEFGAYGVMGSAAGYGAMFAAIFDLAILGSGKLLIKSARQTRLFEAYEHWKSSGGPAALRGTIEQLTNKAGTSVDVLEGTDGLISRARIAVAHQHDVLVQVREIERGTRRAWTMLSPGTKSGKGIAGVAQPKQAGKPVPVSKGWQTTSPMAQKGRPGLAPEEKSQPPLKAWEELGEWASGKAKPGLAQPPPTPPGETTSWQAARTWGDQVADATTAGQRGAKYASERAKDVKGWEALSPSEGGAARLADPKQLRARIQHPDLGKKPMPPKKALRKAEKMFKRAEREMLDLEQEWKGLKHIRGLLEEAGDVTRAGTDMITDAIPWNAGDRQTMFRQFMLRWAYDTIENWGGKLGIYGSKFIHWGIEAEAETAIARTTNMAKLSGWVTSMHDELMRLYKAQAGTRNMKGGVFSSVARMSKNHEIGNGEWAIDIFETWVKGGDDAVAAAFSPKMASVLDDIDTWMLSRYSPLEKIGGLLRITPEDYGLKKYFPQVVRRMTDAEREGAMIKQLTPEIARKNTHWSADAVRERAKLMAARATREVNDNDVRFGSIDFNRYGDGSTMDKIAAGAPLERNPFVTLYRYLDNVEQRSAWGQRFGFNREMDPLMRNLVKSEGGSEALFGNIMDSMLHQKYYPQAMRRIFQDMTNVMYFTKLAFAVIPNATQVANIGAFAGWKNTARGTHKMLTADKANATRVKRIVGATDEWFKAEKRSWMGDADDLNITDWLVEKELKWTGFSFVERTWRKLGGFATKEMVLDDLGYGLAVGHRGRHLDAVRRRFGAVGMSYDDALRRVKNGGQLTNQELDVAMYKGSQLTQFQPDITKRPLGWSTPYGKLFAQFNNFALGHYHFLRRYVLNEAKLGNYRPLASVLATYPIAGEFVGQSLHALIGREQSQDPVWRYVENFTLVGGFGVASAIYAGLLYGRPQGIVTGSFVSEAMEYSSAIVQDAHYALGLAEEGSSNRTVTKFQAEPVVKLMTVLGKGVGYGGQSIYDLWEATHEPEVEFDFEDVPEEPPGTTGAQKDEKPKRLSDLTVEQKSRFAPQGSSPQRRNTGKKSPFAP